MHVFGWWEEAGVSGENQRIHGENMQTPHRKAPAENGTGNPLAVRHNANHHTTVQPRTEKQRYNTKYECLKSINRAICTPYDNTILVSNMITHY